MTGRGGNIYQPSRADQVMTPFRINVATRVWAVCGKAGKPSKQLSLGSPYME